MIDKSFVKTLRINAFGRMLYYIVPWRRKLIWSNVDQVFTDKISVPEKKRLIQAFYTHLAMSIKEMIALRFMSEAKLSSRVEVRGHQRLLDIAAEGRGVLILTGHLGNWEFAPLGGILNFKQFKGQFHFVRRLLGNKTIESILFRRYYQTGLNVIPKKNALEQVCDALDKNHAVVFVLDQHASLANRDGVAVEFFGKKAGTYRSLAMIAQYTGIPVVPAAGYRLANGKHVLEFHDPIFWKDAATSKKAIYENTLVYNQALERMILAHPEQWLWLHKRWKL